MASSGGVFSETLQSITTTKLVELSKKRKIFEDQKTAVFKAVELESDQKKKLRLLVEGVKQCFSIQTATGKKGSERIVLGSTKDPNLEVLLNNLERFLTQAQYDPSVSRKLLRDWEDSLRQQLNVQSLKYQYATLYGELVTEWLTSEQASVPTDNASEKSEEFEHVQRAAETQAREEGRANWERLVFEPYETDQNAIAAYLQDLFVNNGTPSQKIKALQHLRSSVESFESDLSEPDQFDEDVLHWTIKGLLASGLLSDGKCAALRDFLSSPVILMEVADVLNMRMASINSWEWENGGLPVEQRRHVTGKHHIYIEEDLLQAILLQFIGVKWSVFFKDAFFDFSCSDGAWKSLRVSSCVYLRPFAIMTPLTYCRHQFPTAIE
jgi:hypothetical protein